MVEFPVLGDNSRGYGLKLRVWCRQQVGQSSAREVFRRQAQSLRFGSQFLGLRWGQFECQLHVGTVTLGTPSNKRLQPPAATAIVKPPRLKRRR